MAEQTHGNNPIIGGHAVTTNETAQLMVGMNMADRFVMPPQNMGSTKPADAAGGLMQKDAFKAIGLDPSHTLRDQLGGPKGFDYTVFASKSNPKAFYLEMKPDLPGQSAIWLKFTGKPGVNLETAKPPSAEQIQKTQAAMDKVSRYGDFDATNPADTSMGRLYAAMQAYAVEPSHLDIALRTGDRKLIGADMVRINNAGQLPAFCDSVVNAALPITKNQDASVASPEQIEVNKVRNEMMGDNLHATILSELLLNQKVSTKDGQFYKTPNQVATDVNFKLLKLNALRKTLQLTDLEPLYYSETKQQALFNKGVAYKRDDIIRQDVLALFADCVTPEDGLSKPEFTWGNSVEFMPEGGAAFQERLLQIDGLIAQATAGQKVTYDYTIWKHYANKPVDEHQLGPKLAKKLLELANAGGDIHMTVDRTVAFRDPGVVIMSQGKAVAGLLAELAANPNVKLCFFNNDERGTSGDANHSKSAVCNGYSSEATAIVGGRNIHGDYFFGWLDTEFNVKGKLAQSIQRAQDDMWNQQANLHGQPDFIRSKPVYVEPSKQGDVIALATHDMPGPTSHFNGLIGLLAGLEMSGFECTMVQAYVLPPVPNASVDPTLEAIKRAVRQGKIVNIVTNSPQTIDTPQISSAIVKYAAHLLDEVNNMPDAKGSLRIYMKRKWDGIGGGTLHAKVSFDNRWYVSDTSNNLHANGFLQHEGQRYYLDDELNDAVRSWCKTLMDKSDVYATAAQLKSMAEAIDAANIANPALNALIKLFPYQL
ncbi:MAG: phosphatidylserine/phosphatidylglycerophosphate/cardiolipin synthase family protein [Methylococcaceae bacterium]|nr:phosphatidylserine/phosphatidylglycerophosphate/cardiolipin synthase family protein [Methylococcaceae bacterium]